MPELPEVETVRRGLLAATRDQVIAHVEVLRPQTIAHPPVKKFSTLLPGYRIMDINRRGKYLLLYLKNNQGQEAYLVIHLRMSGRLLLINKPKKSKANKFLRLRIVFTSGKELLFEDVRVFGRFWFVPDTSKLISIVPALAKLGPEPLSGLTAKQLQTIFAGRRQAIKAALLNQNLIAGVGNIYADEILFQAGIHPLKPAGQLTLTQYGALAEKIPVVLERAIALGGSSVRDFKDSDGVNGNYQHNAFVYGRFRQPCRICQTIIQRIKIAGRSAHFCPQCQKISKNFGRQNKTKRQRQ